MDIKTYLRGLPPDEREAFAKRCGTTLNFLKQVAYKAKPANAALCLAIYCESDGAVPCESLRPDLPWLRAFELAGRRAEEVSA